MAPQIRELVGYFGRGLLMGTADLIPGISGATIALITGIYGRLIKNIHALFHGKGKRLSLQANWERIRRLEYRFLVPVMLGMATMIGAGSRFIPELIDRHPVFLFSFFLGIILASVVWLYRAIPEKRKRHWSAFALSMLAGVGFALIGIGIEREESNLGLILLMGFLAISAMILPGISGSYVLLIFGHYTLILEAIGSFNLKVLGIFSLGALLALATVSRAINHLLEHHRGVTLFSLTGLMLGAAFKPLDLVLRHLEGMGSVAVGITAALLGAAIFQLLRLAEQRA